MDQIAIQNSTSEFMPPSGYRFRPTDEELIEYYLQNKLRNTLQYNQPFLDVHLYAHNPDDLIAMHAQLEKDQESWYFFTPRERRYQNGSRPQRSAGDGFWKAIGADMPITVNGVLVGYKKILDFFIGGGRNPKDVTRTEWKMHEYLTKDQKDHLNDLPSSSQNSMLLNDCVLCKIYKNQRSLKRKEHPSNENASRNKRANNDISEHENMGQIVQHQNTGQTIQQQIQPAEWNVTVGEQEYYNAGQIVQQQIQQAEWNVTVGEQEYNNAGQIVQQQIDQPEWNVTAAELEIEYAGQIVQNQIRPGENEYAGQKEQQCQIQPEMNVSQPQYDEGVMDLWIDLDFLENIGEEDILEFVH